MGVYTYIEFRNANHPNFIQARDGTLEQRKKWEDLNGPIESSTGERIEHAEDCIIETDEEYGGWLIPVEKIPEGTTHIHVFRG